MVLFMSRIHFKKGLDLLVPAFAKAGVPESVLVIAGPDTDGYAATVDALVKERGLSDRVIFAGMLKGAERIAALADADLFVLPSRQENFGIAVVEALAAGCPVIVSDQVNIHQEITAAGVGGVVPLDIPALAAEIRKWMSDPELRTKAAGHARGYVRQNYDWNEIARRWVQEYASLVV